jgi:hypothetical protein
VAVEELRVMVQMDQVPTAVQVDLAAVVVVEVILAAQAATESFTFSTREQL